MMLDRRSMTGPPHAGVAEVAGVPGDSQIEHVYVNDPLDQTNSTS